MSLEAFLLFFVLAALAAALFFLRRFLGARRQAHLKQVQALESAEKHLQESLTLLDQLVAMLSRIHEMGLSSSTGVNRQELAKAILENACRLMGENRGALLLLDRETFELTVTVARGHGAETVAKTRVKVGQGITGHVAQTGKLMAVENAAADPRIRSGAPLFDHESDCFVAVPLRIKNRTIGVLTVNAQLPKPFKDRDLKLLMILADQAAITLENIDLYDNLHDFYFQLIEALVRAIDAKDAYAYEHAGRARYFGRSIAQKLHLPEQLAQFVEYAALMHDIGKLGIEESILHKTGPLTKEEYEIMKKHPAIGTRIIAPVTFLSPVAPMILYHQEWYNGKGYPEGLSGEEIPLGARIVAIIDVWDAMTSDRPYRKAMTKESAIKEISKGSGAQFDPKVVQAFMEVLQEAERKGIAVTEKEFQDKAAPPR